MRIIRVQVRLASIIREGEGRRKVLRSSFDSSNTQRKVKLKFSENASDIEYLSFFSSRSYLRPLSSCFEQHSVNRVTSQPHFKFCTNFGTSSLGIPDHHQFLKIQTRSLHGTSKISIRSKTKKRKRQRKR